MQLWFSWFYTNLGELYKNFSKTFDFYINMCYNKAIK